MPTLQDVANRAGVSTATVSKVLSNTPYFTEETREKVMDAVSELGYVPNLAARALAAGRTQIVTVVFPYVYDTIFQDPLVMQILEGIEGEATQRAYNLLLSTPRLTEKGPDEHYQKLIRSGYMDGIIAIDNVPVSSVATLPRERNIPTVIVGHHDADFAVWSDDMLGGRQSMQHALELGHSAIGIVSVPPHLNFSIQRRLDGMREAHEAAGLDFETVPVALTDFSIPGGAQAAATLLTQNPDITAVLCVNDRIAMGVIQQARAMGRSVPEELTVIGYDNIAMAEMYDPPLTTINQRAYSLGRSAAQMLIDILNGNQPTPVVLPPSLIIRQSSAPR